MTTAESTRQLRLDLDELAWLLSLRPGPAAEQTATVLGVDVAGAAPARGRAALVARGEAEDRRGETLPVGDAAVAGDVLTAAAALVRVGTADGVAALLAVGPDRVLLLAPIGPDVLGVAALERDAAVGAVTATLAAEVGPGAVVLVARPSLARVDVVAPDPAATLAARVEAAMTGVPR